MEEFYYTYVLRSLKDNNFYMNKHKAYSITIIFDSLMFVLFNGVKIILKKSIVKIFYNQ